MSQTPRGRNTTAKISPEHAATRIQAGFRAYRVRKYYHDQYDPTTKISANPTEPELNHVRAATRIQAGFRGYKTRQALHHSNEQRTEDRYLGTKAPLPSTRPRTDADQAAAKIQASFRGYMTRREMKQHQKPQNPPIYQKDHKPYESAYIPLTSSSPQRDSYLRRRSVNVPETVKLTKVDTPDQMDHAATVIQAGFRGYKTRQLLHSDPSTESPHKSRPEFHEDKENEKQAATRIQATYRGFATRKKMRHPEQSRVERNQHDMDATRAATKIQAAFRGYTTRHHLHQTSNRDHHERNS